MEPPVFFYYELDNFYQNHRRYIKSRSSDQLAGEEIDSTSDCDPLVTNEEMGKTVSIEGNQLDPRDVAVPCGLIAGSFFNDTFEINNIRINEEGIAWPSDKNEKFKNTNDRSKQWIDMTDEHFIVWMRTAGLPNFRKLWGRINQVIEAGEHTVRIQNNYDVVSFEGTKAVVISTTGPFGGKNQFLAISYIVVGVICLFIAGFFGIRWKQLLKKNE
mmetsp:Transcript_3639/g.3110  ORF Transcript_3639/g.3110 Transcript_3639/m.3110 type:complete len:215 (-) Transcript_3639:127-771(-)